VIIIAVGLSYRTAGLGLLERVAVPAGELPETLADLLAGNEIGEAVVLSTCNRTEIYASAATFHGGLENAVGVLSRRCGVEPAVLRRHLYPHHGQGAVEHLFTVAAGLDSMVRGETQILGQLRTAYCVARDSGSAGRLMHDLSQRALRVGKRVRAETGLHRSGASVVSEALADAAGELGGLAGKRALLIGAGSIGAVAAAALRRAGIGEVVIANRTESRGARLAEAMREHGVPAESVGLHRIAGLVGQADLVITCTGAGRTVLDVPTVLAAAGRRLVVCDLALPRDVAAGVGELPGVRVIDLESLRRRLAGAAFGADTGRARLIVAEEVARYVAAQRSAAVTPTVTALRRRAAEVVDSELLRLDSRLADLDPLVRKELAGSLRRVVDKLLHTPTVRVKASGADYAAMLCELFELPPEHGHAA
jgi:glutamyl-tRNA reductase